jgi:photosystem II stability/assembly factor-like uncharacterized protein
MKAVFFRSLSRPFFTFLRSSTFITTVLLLALAAFDGVMADDAQKPAIKVLDKSPAVFAMPTKLMDKSMVQDIIRVGERLFIVGERGHIGWSDDNGATWQQAKVPTIQDLNSIYFVTQELGWAVGHDGNIFNTSDGGKTWLLQLDGVAYNLIRAKAQVDHAAAQLSAKQQEVNTAQSELDAAQDSGNKKKVDALQATLDKLQEQADDFDFQVRDAKKILEEENAPWPLMGVWFSDLNNGYAVGAFNAFLITHDGGKTWEDASSRLDNHESLHLNAIDGQGSTVFIGGEGGLLFRSRDAGATWQKLASPSDGSFYAIRVMPTAQSDVDIMAVGIQGRIYHSSNSGESWTRIEHDINNNLNGIFEDGNGLVLIVGNDGAMLRSTDGGVTFETQHRFDQVTMTSVVVAANGNYILTGANGIKVLKPDQWSSVK